MSDENGGHRLGQLIRNELANVRLDHWGFFFPAHVAVWRFIHEKWPAALDDVKAGYDTEPWFAGRGANWFTAELLNVDEFVDIVDRVMRAAVDHAMTTPAKERGFLLPEEVPEVDAADSARLAQIVANSVDDALRRNAIAP